MDFAVYRTVTCVPNCDARSESRSETSRKGQVRIGRRPKAGRKTATEELKKGDQEEEKHRWEVRLRSRKREREEN